MTNILNNIRKLCRFILSGYLFERSKIMREGEIPNYFIPNYRGEKDVKLAVYTVITGGYDEIKEPIFIDDNVDYYVITSNEISPNSVWKKIDINNLELMELSPLEQARYIKTHPHIFFSNYEYSMFIDGNVCITSSIRPLFYTMIEENKIMAIHRHQSRDCLYHEARIVYGLGLAKYDAIKNQITKYKKDKFPRHYGLFETNIIIRKHNDENCIKIMEEWWNQIRMYTKRDQLSFTYTLWKCGYSSNYIMSLGNNSRKSTYFNVTPHIRKIRHM
jgi:hypothetical protein